MELVSACLGIFELVTIFFGGIRRMGMISFFLGRRCDANSFVQCARLFVLIMILDLSLWFIPLGMCMMFLFWSSGHLFWPVSSMVKLAPDELTYGHLFLPSLVLALCISRT